MLGNYNEELEPVLNLSRLCKGRRKHCVPLGVAWAANDDVEGTSLSLILLDPLRSLKNNNNNFFRVIFRRK